MVSINKLGQAFNYNPSFNAAAANNSVQTPDAAKIQEGKAKLKSFAKSQVNLGYATLGAGVLEVNISTMSPLCSFVSNWAILPLIKAPVVL